MFQAKSMFEYGLAFCILIAMINGIAIYSIFIWQSENTLKFIHNCEEFVETSKYYSEQGANHSANYFSISLQLLQKFAITLNSVAIASHVCN